MSEEYKGFFKTVTGNEGDKCQYPTRLDTYGKGCANNCHYCLEGSTQIFMYDCTFKSLSAISVGDELYGVIDATSERRKYVKSVVTNTSIVEKPSFKITLSNGTELVCSEDHRWLTTDGWKYTQKSDTEERPFLEVGDTLFGFEFVDGEVTYQVVSIAPHSENQILYDITTTTHNFIANGIVSHNCYAKSMLLRYSPSNWNILDPAVADINKIRKKIAKLDKKITVRLGGMTDCFQECEKTHKVTYETIKALNENRINYLIVTKCPTLLTSDEYMEILDKDLAHIQISVTCLDDERAKTYEQGADLSSERIKCYCKLDELGYDVSLRLSPYIPDFMDIDKLIEVAGGRRKLQVEFLRLNTLIKRVFPFTKEEDFPLYQSGYKHMSLPVKKYVIDKLKPHWKEISVCEDVTEHYEYWKANVNHNPNDCCNLTFKDR